MRLTKLEIKGFKSFRDKTVLEFPDNMTAVVGPNGSGKSNLTEAICFVLGRSRGLRAANLQELIFNGGLNDKPADKAVVSMVLVDDNGAKFKVTRMVDREGRSNYNLNDKRVTRTKIVDIVGDNEYNILLQDDVTKVIEMRPKERRTIIDGICGIAEYDEKKDKALRELDKVEKRVGETHIVLGEKQGYMNKLKRERDEALNYQETRDGIKQHQATILSKNMLTIQNRNEKLNIQLDEIRVSKSGDQKRIDELRIKINEGTQELKTINSSIIDLEEEKSRQRILQIESEIGRKEDYLQMLDQRLGENNESRGKRKSRKELLEEESGEIKTTLVELSSKLESLRAEIEEEAKLSSDGQIETRIDDLRKNVYELHSRAKTLKELNNSDQISLDGLHREEKELQENLDAINERRNAIGSDLEEKQSKLTESTSKLAKAKTNLEDLRIELSEKNHAVEELRVQVAEKKANLRALEQASHGLKSAIKAVMKIKDVVPGIQGPVFQLGNVTKKEYETALQIAAGARMQNIVVDNVDVAGKCIDYLRKKQVGRATFLPLDKIEVKIEGKLPEGAVGFARDFISTDSKYKQIFEYVFGNTIVVKDLEAAKNIGVGKWRMVTMEGDLLESSGAITGGHTKKIEIGFSNIDDQEKQIQGDEKKLESLQNELENLEENEGNLRNDLAKAEMDVAEHRDAESTVSFEEKGISEKAESIQQSLDKIKTRISEIEENCGKRDSELGSLRGEIESGETEVTKLSGERGDRDSSILDKLKDQERDLEVQDSTLKEKQSLIESQLTEINQELERLEGETKRDNEGKKEAEETIAKLKAERSEMEQQSAKVIKDIEEFIEKRTRIEEHITENSEQIGSIERSFELVNEQINEINIEKAKNDTQLEGLQVEYEKYGGVELLEKAMKDLKDDLEKLEMKMTQFGSINMRAIETFEQIHKEYQETFDKLNTLKSERQSIYDFMDQVEKKKQDTFMKTFDVVKENFEAIFHKLSEGQGTLMLDNPTNISDSGLLIKASPGGKKVMSLDAMSGGEKVLTSAAFLLAVQQYKPSDFYIIDELDAALDKVNSIKLTEMFRESETQFILVTHNDSVLKHLNSVIGVSMSEGISQIVGVKLAGVKTE